MPDIDKLSNTERPLPMGPVAGGSQRRSSLRSYKATAAGRREEDRAREEALAQAVEALVGAADVDMTLTGDESSGEALIRVVDRRSGRVIAEMTPEELLRTAMAQPRGLFVNKKG